MTNADRDELFARAALGNDTALQQIRRMLEEAEAERDALRAVHDYKTAEKAVASGYETRLIAAKALADVLRNERDELQRTFDLMWDADQRAIKRWQDAAPAGEDRSLTWPDRSKLTEWLLVQVDNLSAQHREDLDKVFTAHAERNHALRVVEAAEKSCPLKPFLSSNDPWKLVRDALTAYRAGK